MAEQVARVPRSGSWRRCGRACARCNGRRERTRARAHCAGGKRLVAVSHRLDELEKKFETAQRERDEYRRLCLEMMERCRKLERGLWASRSEHLSKDDPQLSLDVLSERCRTGHSWVLVAPERHVLFEYTPEHSSDAVDDVLAGYRGYLVADAHVVYDHLYKTGDVVEVNCWAHARRYFFKALASDPDRAKTALSLIGALFRIERTLADSPRKKKEKIRQKRSLPIIERFFSWCDAEASNVLDDMPISDGIRYARNQRVGSRDS